MTQYSKLIAHVIGALAIIAGPQVLGLVADEGQLETVLTQLVAAVVAGFAVFQVPNKPKV